MKHEVIKFTFGEKGKKSWCLDHRDVPVAVSFTPTSGDLLLHLEAMPCGFCLPGDTVEFIELVKTRKTFFIFVNYLGMKGTTDEYYSRLLIGKSSNPELLKMAEGFVQSLNLAFYSVPRERLIFNLYYEKEWQIERKHLEKLACEFMDWLVEEGVGDPRKDKAVFLGNGYYRDEVNKHEFYSFLRPMIRNFLLAFESHEVMRIACAAAGSEHTKVSISSAGSFSQGLPMKGENMPSGQQVIFCLAVASITSTCFDLCWAAFKERGETITITEQPTLR